MAKQNQSIGSRVPKIKPKTPRRGKGVKKVLK